MTRARNASNRRAGFIEPDAGRRSRGTARRERLISQLRRPIAMLSAGALITTMLVAVGLTAASTPASAAAPAPNVTTSIPASYLAGEDVAVGIEISSANSTVGNKYNLSLGVVLPEHVSVLDTGALGVPYIFPITATDRVIPGTYMTVAGTCSTLGLENANPQPYPGANACQVPLGKQYFVFQNVSDLPQSAATAHVLTLRPDADVFPVGSPDLDLVVTAYTSDDERYVPLYPGSRGLALDDAATSAPGVSHLDIPVQALRIEKAEPSPESELLRGVHSNTTTYTLRVHHTGEGDITSTTVVDYLPAGLEYLGLGGVDNTTNANGTQNSAAEYPGAPALTATPLPSPAPGAWQTAGELVETIIPTAAEVADYGLTPGAVYTKVTWDLGTLLAATEARDTDQGIAQGYPADAGEPGLLEIRYRAAVPLFENTLDFDGAGGQPGTLGEQTANLDNNRGASTRHGHAVGDSSDAPATSYTNFAVASGLYGGAGSEDVDAHTIDAVDVRVVKSVDDSTFEQGTHARFTLALAASEYTSAVIPGPATRPYRLIDRMEDGICPVFPVGTPVQHTPGNPHSSPGAPVPNLVLGDPLNPAASHFNAIADWNQALIDHSVASDCEWGAAIDPTYALEGAQIVGLAFDPATARFAIDFAIDPSTVLEADASHDVVYSVRENESYVIDDGDQGATSSGDTVENYIELYAETTSIPALAGIESAGGAVADGIWNASDDSAAEVIADFSDLDKHVLQRSAGAFAAADIAKSPGDGGPAPSDWVDAAPDPFTIGDEVWYRIRVTPPSGSDVRNPRLTDFLPLGVEFDPTDSDSNGRPDNMWVVPSSLDGLGTCNPADSVDWLNTFVPFGPTDVNGNVLNFRLGSADCFGAGSTDRFLPLDTVLSFYLKVTVTDLSAFGTVDLPENLAKYQQQNVAGEIFFLRDAAAIELDQSTLLLKGIRDIDGVPAPAHPFNSDHDGEEVVQGDAVTFRVDVTGAQVASTDYLIWDALPAGITKDDIRGANALTGVIDPADAPAATVTGAAATETPLGAGTWSATVYDPADAGYPTADLRADIVAADRSVIVWQVDATVPASIPATGTDPAIAQGLTLAYTVDVPQGTAGPGVPGALLNERYVNTASIVRYSAVNNGAGVTTPLVPEGSGTLSTSPATDTPGAVAIAEDGTFDDSDVYLPGATMSKVRTTTEIPSTSPAVTDPNNPANVIVQGEHVRYDVAVTIPANTTVQEGVLADLGRFVGQSGNGTISPSNTFGFQVRSATVSSTNPGFTVVPTTGSDPAVDATNFGFRTDTGTLVFPEYYTTGAADETFTVELVVWTRDVSESHPTASGTRPNIPNNKVLRNTAVFDSTALDGTRPRMERTADVTYREPLPSLTKNSSGAVGADGDVTFTLTASNANNRPALYDAVVYDCLPSGLTAPAPAFVESQGTATYPATPCHVTGTGTDQRVVTGSGDGTLIEWQVGRIDAGTPQTLTFTAKVDPGAGGGATYTNRAHLVGATLPSTIAAGDPSDGVARRGDRATGASREVTLADATLAKSVSPTEAPVGDTVTYTLETTLPADANFYDVTLEDTLPAGLSYDGNPTIAFGGFTVDPAMSATPSVSGQTLTWTVDAPGDIAFHSDPRTITVTFDAVVTDSVISAAPRNTSEFRWRTTDGDGTTERETPPATADVTILNPALQIVKKVDAEDAITRNPDATFDYTLVVSQTAAGTTPAHHITVQDVVPAGVKVDTTQAALDDATFSNATDLDNGLGGTITWQLTGPLDTQGGSGVTSINLGYEGAFVDSIDLAAADFPYVNVANVTHFESFGTGGRSYDPPLTGTGSIRDTAGVTPVFPHVVPAKTVTTPVPGETYGVAEEGVPFNWTLRVTNQSPGTAQDVSVTDVLPTNWEYVPGSAEIQIVGAPTATPLADPALTPLLPITVGEQQTLVWDEATIRDAGVAPLAQGIAFIITFDAIPTAWALTDAGTGILVNAHTNTLSVTATDTQGAYVNGDGDYVGDDSAATAYIAEMDLLLEKAGIGGVTDSTAFDGLPLETWIAGQGVVAGYAQPQWQITVTNQGPDAGFGPFEITDTMGPLPSEVSVGDWSARYFSGPGDTTGTALGTFTAGSSTFTVGTTATSLQADGSDRIVLTANVAIDADAYSVALPAALTLANEASVTGRTYEDPANFPDNEDSDSKDIEELADLSIAKVVTNPVPPAAPVVDADVTWQISVTNLGPSVSRSPAATPITVTDTVPAGVGDVTATTNGDWVPTVTRGGVASSFPAAAGDVITWTYQGDEMPVAATAAVSLTGTILPSHTGDLINSATVNPGDTPDPVTPNNSSEVPVTPDDSTTMSIVKTRVVDDGAGGWRQADPSTDPDDAFVAGDPVHYLISVTNAGPADARDVAVVDEVPAGLTYNTHADVVGTWTYASGGTTSTGTDASWNTFTLSGTQTVGAANATSFVITYDTDTTLTGDVENWAEVTIDNWDPTDPDGPYDRDDDDTGSTRIVDLGIVKSHTGTGPFTPGTEVEYTLVVTNHGPSATNGEIEIADSLPVGMSYVAGSAAVTVPTGTTSPADPEPALSGTDSRVLTWSLLDAADTFDLSETITVTFRGLIDPLLRESVSLTNDSEVDGPDTEPSPDPNPNEDDDTIVTTGTDADMTIAKTVAVGPWVAGTDVEYTLTITNAGPSAVPASVTDTLPTGLSLVSMTGTNWDCSTVVPGATAGTCDYLDGADTDPVTQVLHPVGVSTITVTAHIAPTVVTGTDLDNEAVLTWTDGSGSHTDDDEVPITVTTDADLGIVKDVITGATGTVIPDPASVTPGETAWYRLQVTNHGPSDAVGPITVVDELPLGVTVPTTLTNIGPWAVVADPVVPATRQVVTLTLAGGLLANTAADANRGVAAVIEFEVDLDPSIADGATLTNDSDVSSPTPDSNPLNDEDTADILAERLVDLGVVKSHPVDTNGQVVIDQPLDFTIQVTNYGPSEASGVEIIDTVPVGLEVTSVVGPVAGTGWTIDSIVLVDPLDPEAGAVVTATYAPTLGVTSTTNEADPLVISTIVRESAVGTSPNHVEVSGNEPEPTPDPNPNEFDDPIDVLPRVTLVVTKTAVGAFQVGKRGTYEITVENFGPHDDPGPLEVEDVLPAGLTYYASPHPGVAVVGQTVTWTIPSLAIGDIETITLVVDVHQAAYPSVTNVATVTTPSELTPASDPDDDDTVTVAEADPIALTGLDMPVLAFGIGILLLLGGTAIVAATTRRRWIRRID